MKDNTLLILVLAGLGFYFLSRKTTGQFALSDNGSWGDDLYSKWGYGAMRIGESSTNNGINIANSATNNVNQSLQNLAGIATGINDNVQENRRRNNQQSIDYLNQLHGSNFFSGGNY